MKVIKTTLVALTIVSASAVGAMAHDGEPNQTGLTQTGQDTLDIGHKAVTNRQTVVKVISPYKHVPTPTPYRRVNMDGSATN